MGTRHEHVEPFTLSQGLLREGWEEAVADILSRRLYELRTERTDTRRNKELRSEED